MTQASGIDPRVKDGWQPTYEPSLLENVLTPSMCEETLRVAHRIGFEPSSVLYGNEPGDNPAYRRSESVWLKPEDAPELYRTITVALQNLNNRLYRFSIYGMDQIQILKYEPGCFFIEHSDIAHAHAARRKISLIVQLSDAADYDGGDVVLASRVTVPKALGGGCIFPSWVLHRVDAITRGTRYSLTTWANGTYFL